MTVSIEWEDQPAGTLRIHKPGEGFGDGYDWCCTVVKKSKDTVVLKGATDVPVEYRGEIESALKAEGFRFVSWFRRGRGWRLFRL